jgi:hypothetical protein
MGCQKWSQMTQDLQNKMFHQFETRVFASQTTSSLTSGYTRRRASKISLNETRWLIFGQNSYLRKHAVHYVLQTFD